MIALLSPELTDAWQSAMQTIVLTIIGLLGTVLTALITAGSRQLITWLNAKAGAAGSDAHAAAFRCATEKLSTWSRAAVDEVEQTLVRKLKRQGTWNKETARMARDTAVEIMRKHAGERGLAELEQCLGITRDTALAMFRTWIERQVRADGSSGALSPIVSMGDASDDLDGDGQPDNPNDGDASEPGDT